MINTKRSINSFQIKSNNLLNDIKGDISVRDGFSKGKNPRIPVYFYRYIGISSTEVAHAKTLTELDFNLRKHNKYINLKSPLHLDTKSDVFLKNSTFWTNSNNIDSNYIISVVKEIFKDNFLNINSHELVLSSIEHSLNSTLKIYIANEKYPNSTSLKTLSSKLLFWIDHYLSELISSKLSSIDDILVLLPKTIFLGDIKKHEMYFLFFLSILGSDVIYFNSKNDPFTSLTRNFSDKIEFNNKVDNKDWVSSKPVSKTNYVNEISKGINRFIISSKNSSDILIDSISPLTSRVGFKSGNSPIIPNFFVRYLGVKESTDLFSNEIFNMHKSLLNKSSMYIMFNGIIPIKDISKIQQSTSEIWKTLTDNSNEWKDSLSNSLVQSGVLKVSNDAILNNTCIYAFNFILTKFIDDSTSSSVSKIKNFVIKLLHWIHSYSIDPLLSFDYLKKNSTDVYNPTVLYYGEIKSHESYFLLYLSKMGFDVIYINPSKNDMFKLLDPQNDFSMVQEFDHQINNFPFPTEELFLRQETTARLASNEIDEMIFTDDGGMYKPWQLERYSIVHLTLKTTYEELKILWDQPAKFRTGFKVLNNSVSIPNLFAKISGVSENLTSYCGDINTLRSSKNTKFIDSVPFTQKNYTSFELNSVMNIFARDGSIDKQKLQSSNLYSLSHLRTAVQDDIYNKLNSLVKMQMFTENAPKDFILKIVISILKMDKSIFNMIQMFDYPDKIPKIVILDTNEHVFSSEDTIILAFLNLMCFDIVIFTPTGYNNIESSIKEKYYDIHRLENINLNFSTNSIDRSISQVPSMFKNLFSKKSK